MIHGGVNPRLEAILPVPLLDSAGQWHLIDATIDTGYSGSLTLPLSMIWPLGLPKSGSVFVALADGTLLTRDLYHAQIDWDGAIVAIEVMVFDGHPLVGTRLLRNSRITIEAVSGGAVTIEPIP
jgi:clan AA aspartic protease